VFIDLGDVADALILADGSFETTSHMLARRGSTDKFLTQDSTFLSSRKSIRSLSVSSEGGTMGGDTNHGSTSSSKKGGGDSSSSSSRFASVKMPRSMKAIGTANELAASAVSETASSAPTDKKGVSFFPVSKELMTEEREGKKEEKERKSVGFASVVLPSSSSTNNGVSSGGVGEMKKKKSVLIKTPMEEENNAIYQL
jgi:hypothetical protein